MEYGPNDAEVLRFLERVSNLTLDEAERLVAARRASSDPEGTETDRIIRRAALMSDRTEALEAAHAAIRAWGRTWGVPWFGRSRRVYWDRHVPVASAAAMAACTPALLDAIGGLVVRDVLGSEEALAILQPWHDAIGDGGGTP